MLSGGRLQFSNDGLQFSNDGHYYYVGGLRLSAGAAPASIRSSLALCRRRTDSPRPPVWLSISLYMDDKASILFLMLSPGLYRPLLKRRRHPLCFRMPAPFIVTAVNGCLPESAVCTVSEPVMGLTVPCGSQAVSRSYGLYAVGVNQMVYDRKDNQSGRGVYP